MSNRSSLTELAAGAFSSGSRSRSGHRYRDDDQPFLPGAGASIPSTTHRAAPSHAAPSAEVDTHSAPAHSAPAHPLPTRSAQTPTGPAHAAPLAAAASFGAYAARTPSSEDTAAWSRAGGAWNEDTSWNDGSSWTQAPARPGHEAAAPQPAWEQESGAAWGGDGSWNDNSGNGDAWNDGAAWDGGAAWNAGEDDYPARDAWSGESGAWGEETGRQRDDWAGEDPSQWQGTCDSDAWARQSQWPHEPEDDWTESADEASGDNRAGVAGIAAAAAPVAPTYIPGRGAQRRGGAHRVPAPPGSLKGRAAVVAVAAGAAMAAGQAAMADPGKPSQTLDYEAAGQIHEIAAQSMSLADPNASSASPQVLNVAAPADLSQFNDMLENGRKFAEELAAAEAAKLRPLFVKFTNGNFTSGFGARWGVQHLGVDVAAPIGTPIYAVADGTIIDAGPASGFGMWVRILHEDGTVTVYGHVDTATVSVGEYVMAGDQIATVGNRGFSTGPHVHFEVWLNGTDKIDPLPWLATRGIALGQYRG